MKPTAQKHKTPVPSFTKNIKNFNLVHSRLRRDSKNSFVILSILLMRQYMSYKNTLNLNKTFYTVYIQNYLKF